MAVEIADVVRRAQMRESYWNARTERINEWIALETLFDANEEPGYESAVSNGPATVMSMAVHLLSGQPVKHRAKVGGQTDAALRKAGALERALGGWWNLVDDMAFFSGRDTFLRELAYWMALTGWYSVLLGVKQDAAHGLRPIVDFHDPRTAFQEYGSSVEGLLGYTHKYETTLAEAQALATRGGVSTRDVAGDPTIPIVIYDDYRVEGGRVIHVAAFGFGGTTGQSTGGRLGGGSVAGQWLHYEEVLETDTIPILTGPVGGSPWRISPRRSGTMGTVGVGVAEWQKRMGMSVLETNRVLWTQFNKYYSLLLEVAKNYAEPDKVRLRLDAGGERRTTLRSGGNVYDTDDVNARIMRDEPGRSPIEVLQVLEQLSQESQRGGFPHVLYGATALDLSGFAISQLLQAALHRVGPYKTAMQRVIRQADKWFLDDFRGRQTEVILSGKQAGGGVYMEKFSSADVPAEYALEVDVDLSMPSDMMERIAIVRNAIPGNEPVLDLLTALEDVVKVDDPQLVIDRIAKNRLNLNPDIQRLEAIMAIRARAKDLREAGERDTADLLDEYAEFLRTQAAGAMGGGGPQGAEKSMGLDPRAMPAEMLGISPNVTRRMRNPGTPNLSRRFNRGA